MTSKHRVFIYGTLREEGREATHELIGYEMYNYHDKFPYIKATADGEAVVRGNIMEADDTHLDYLDRYEGVDSGLYDRVQVEVYQVGSDVPEQEMAWVYVAGNILPPRIVSGDWHRRDEE